MKKCILMIAGLLVCACVLVCLAEPPRLVQFTDVVVETTNVATTVHVPDNDAILSGWIDTIIVDQTGATSGTVSLVTLASGGTGASRTLFIDTTVGGDATWPVRDLATVADGTDIANTPAKHVIVGDKLRLYAYNWAAAATATVYVVISDTPGD